MSEQTKDTVERAVKNTELLYRQAQREYETLAKSAPKAKRVQLLHSWNDAAGEYFTACITALGTPTSTYTANAQSWATDWLRYAAVHYSAIKRQIESKNLGLDFDQFKPGLAKFDALQRLVTDPTIARDLRIELIEAGLATYVLDGVKNPADHDERSDRKRWFAFGCVLFAVAVGFAVWGFYLGELEKSQRDILVWILPLSSGFAAGAFAGSITARARGLLPGSVIVATGGFAVWLIASFLLFPEPSSAEQAIKAAPTATAFVVQLNGEPGIAGRTFEVELGFVEANAPVRFTLGVRLDAGSGRFKVGTAPEPLSLSSSGDVDLSTSSLVSTAVQLNAGPAEGPQIREVRLFTSSAQQGEAPALMFRVRWQALSGSVTVDAHSGARPSGRGQDSSQPYEVCANAPTSGEYVWTSGREWLTGDRACGSWSTCTPRRETSKHCLVFTLQGHSESTGFASGCDPIRSSEGHVEATFQLRPSKPMLRAV